MTFAWMAAERAEFTIAECCRALQVSPSGFYAWQQRPESRHAARDRQLRVLIRASHAGSRRAYGSPRVLEDLLEQGVAVSRKRVARLMRDEGLVARVRKRFRATTIIDHDQPIAANVLDRQFAADRPNQRWVLEQQRCGGRRRAKPPAPARGRARHDRMFFSAFDAPASAFVADKRRSDMTLARDVHSIQ